MDQTYLHQPRARYSPPIEHLPLARNAGTIQEGSTLDIERLSPESTFGAIAPLLHERVLEIFRTEYPTRDMVARGCDRVDSLDAEPLYRRWEGVHIIVYRDTEPVEILFEGCSGD
jgi:hypothetical protein